MSIEADIEQALINVVKNSSGFNPATQIKYPGIAFNPLSNLRWLELSNFRNIDLSETWGSERVIQGIFQVTVCDPLQLGAIPVLVIAGPIRDLFKKGTNIPVGKATIKFEVEPYIMSAIEAGEVTKFPVSCQYRCYSGF